MLAKDKLVVVRVDLYMLMAMFEQPVLVDVGAEVAGQHLPLPTRGVDRLRRHNAIRELKCLVS